MSTASRRANRRDKGATQDMILTAAIELFSQRGYAGTTVTNIAERAGVCRATVFWHFSDKASVFREAFFRMLDPFRESFSRCWDDVELDKRLEAQISVAERFATSHGDEIASFVKWALEAPEVRAVIVDTLLDLNRRFAGVLTETVCELVPEQHAPEYLGRALMLAFDADLLLGMFDPSARSHEERMKSVYALVDAINRDARHHRAA